MYKDSPCLGWFKEELQTLSKVKHLYVAKLIDIMETNNKDGR